MGCSTSALAGGLPGAPPSNLMEKTLQQLRLFPTLWNGAGVSKFVAEHGINFDALKTATVTCKRIVDRLQDLDGFINAKTSVGALGLSSRTESRMLWALAQGSGSASNAMMTEKAFFGYLTLVVADEITAASSGRNDDPAPDDSVTTDGQNLALALEMAVRLYFLFDQKLRGSLPSADIIAALDNKGAPAGFGRMLPAADWWRASYPNKRSTITLCDFVWDMQTWLTSAESDPAANPVVDDAVKHAPEPGHPNHPRSLSSISALPSPAGLETSAAATDGRRGSREPQAGGSAEDAGAQVSDAPHGRSRSAADAAGSSPVQATTTSRSATSTGAASKHSRGSRSVDGAFAARAHTHSQGVIPQPPAGNTIIGGAGALPGRANRESDAERVPSLAAEVPQPAAGGVGTIAGLPVEQFLTGAGTGAAFVTAPESSAPGGAWPDASGATAPGKESERSRTDTGSGVGGVVLPDAGDSTPVTAPEVLQAEAPDAASHPAAAGKAASHAPGHVAGRPGPHGAFRKPAMNAGFFSRGDSGGPEGTAVAAGEDVDRDLAAADGVPVATEEASHPQQGPRQDNADGGNADSGDDGHQRSITGASQGQSHPGHKRAANLKPKFAYAVPGLD